MPRDYTYEILPEIKQRWAVKSFGPDKLGREDILPLLEAARYAPSCYNEQPWRFLIGDSPDTFDRLASTVAPGNAWAKEAGALVLVLCTRTFKLNGKPNPYARFDTGTATGFLQLEAIRRGLVCHSFAGFDADRARSLLGVAEELDIIDMIALGHSAAQTDGQPGTRNPLADLIVKG